MAHPTGSTVAGSVIHRMADGARPIIVVNIPQIMSQAKTTTESINQIIDNYGFMLDNNAVIYLNSTAIPMLQNLYHDLCWVLITLCYLL